MAARRPFWKWHRWKSIGFCLWAPSTCIWNLKFKFQSKLDLCSGNHVVYRQTDGRTDGQTDRRTRWIQYTPPPTSLGGGIMTLCFYILLSSPEILHSLSSVNDFVSWRYIVDGYLVSNGHIFRISRYRQIISEIEKQLPILVNQITDIGKWNYWYR